MDKTTTMLISLLFVFTFITTSSSIDLCNEDDKNALLRIKKSLSNPNHLASWDSQTDCCSWTGIECGNTTINYRVTSLSIISANISGQIPPEVGDLSYLEDLAFLRVSNLTGEIPHTLVKLKNLQFLLLSSTKLTGPVPEFLSQLTNLDHIIITSNYLSGPIPASLSLLPNLVSLDLTNNKLTGSIPESFGSFPGTVPDLLLSHNHLSGLIPKSLGNLDFPRINLSKNKFKGDATMLFGANKTTFYILLSRNMFEFDISKVEISNTINFLELDHNKLTGNIPTQWTQAPLRSLNVSYNRLCGRIPTGGNFQNFYSYSYIRNTCLCGEPLESCK